MKVEHTLILCGDLETIKFDGYSLSLEYNKSTRKFRIHSTGEIPRAVAHELASQIYFIVANGGPKVEDKVHEQIEVSFRGIKQNAVFDGPDDEGFYVLRSINGINYGQFSKSAMERIVAKGCYKVVE